MPDAATVGVDNESVVELTTATFEAPAVTPFRLKKTLRFVALPKPCCLSNAVRVRAVFPSTSPLFGVTAVKFTARTLNVVLPVVEFALKKLRLAKSLPPMPVQSDFRTGTETVSVLFPVAMPVALRPPNASP